MSIQLAQSLRAFRTIAIFGFAFCGLFGSAASAHVGLDSPNGGEMLVGGFEFTIKWHVQVEHNQLDWDLWYSTESNEGPWQEIALDLAKGNTAAESVHTFDWSLPDLDISTAWVRVRQDNVGQDYFGISEASFSIAAMLGDADFTGDGNVDAADLVAWQQGFGATLGAAPADGDADRDTDVDGTDFLAWQSEYQVLVSAPGTQSVPEPVATVLLLLGMIFLLCQRR